MPGTWPLTQLIMSPRRHGSQWPQLPPNQPTPARWPTVQGTTASPTASIRPAISCPGTRGYSIPGTPPSMVKASEWQTPQACSRSAVRALRAACPAVHGFRHTPRPDRRATTGSAQGLGQGCDLLGATPRERDAGAAVAVVVDQRGAVGEV